MAHHERSVFWVGLLAAACGGGPRGAVGPAASFPTREEIADATAEPARPALTFTTRAVESWQITSPVPVPGSEYPLENGWDRTLVDAVKRSGGRARLSAELRCAATEMARFYTHLEAYPDDALRRYLIQRCGSSLPGAALQTLHGEITPGTSEAQVLQQYRPDLEKMLAPELGRTFEEVGLGFFQSANKASVVVLGGKPRGRLHGFAPLVTGPRVMLTGEGPRDASVVVGYVNHGPLGFSECDSDRSLRAPRFRLSCPVAEADAQTRVQISSQTEGQMLMSPILEVLVRRDEQAGLLYEEPPAATGAPAKGASTRDTLFLALNATRRAAGVPALALEPRQSQTNGKLAPHLLEASIENDAERSDLLALGMLAGWDVKGTIRSGGVYFEHSSSSNDPLKWLANALASPLARSVLLEPEVTRVAIGDFALEPSGMIAAVTTYALFANSQNHQGDEDAIFRRIERARSHQKLPPARRVASAGALKSALAKIAKNEIDGGDALDQALYTIAQHETRPLSGWVIETSDLKYFPLPEQVYRQPDLEVSIGVTHRRVPGAAWGQYAVLIVFYGDAATLETAAGASPGRG